MKNNTRKVPLLTLVAAALVALPVVSRAEDSTNPPPPASTHPAKKIGGLPFKGKVAAVDPSAAMTFTVGTLTMAVTSETKITKDGQPATFADITAGASVTGSYKKGADGKLTASSVKLGEKKKKAAPATP